MFADDITLLFAGQELAINSYLALIMAYHYCHCNDVVVNKTKIKQLAFGGGGGDIAALPEVEMKPSLLDSTHCQPV